MKLVEHGMFLRRPQEGGLEACYSKLDDLPSAEPHALRMAIFVAHRGFKHGRIVAGKRYRQAAPEKRRKRVLVVSGRRAANLASQRPSAKVARRTDFQRNISRGDEVHGALVAHHADAVADALHSQQLNCLADDFRSTYFSCMNQP